MTKKFKKGAVPPRPDLEAGEQGASRDLRGCWWTYRYVESDRRVPGVRPMVPLVMRILWDNGQMVRPATQDEARRAFEAGPGAATEPTAVDRARWDLEKERAADAALALAPEVQWPEEDDATLQAKMGPDERALFDAVQNTDSLHPLKKDQLLERLGWPIEREREIRELKESLWKNYRVPLGWCGSGYYLMNTAEDFEAWDQQCVKRIKALAVQRAVIARLKAAKDQLRAKDQGQDHGDMIDTQATQGKLP